MIETCFFTCPDKGKMLAVYFDKKDQISHEYLKQFSNCDNIDRYIELIFRHDGKQTMSGLIKQELEYKEVVKEIIDCLVNNINPELEL